MKITIEVVVHSEQRYPTCGDWFFEKNGDLTIRVSKLNNWKFEVLVGLHEAVEALLCKSRDIDETAVTLFDKQFEFDRHEGNNDEPGDDPRAPYKKEHFFATNIEALLSAELEVDWNDYERRVNELE